MKIKRCFRPPGAAFVIAALMTACAGVSPAQAQELVGNGGFETPEAGPGDWTTYSAATEPNALHPWVITANTVDHKNETFLNGPSQSVDLQGVDPGAIAQDLATAAGALYEVSFALNANTVCGEPVKTMGVNWNGARVATYDAADANHPVEARNWVTKTLFLRAGSGATTRLEFEDLSDPSTCGAMIDDVSVTAEQLGPPSPDKTTDTDGDAIADYYETHGFDWNNDGRVDLDLPAMGSNPNVKDIFIEVDQMRGHVWGEVAGWVRPMAAAFRAHKIRLHIDLGTRSTMDWATGRKWGNFSDSNIIPHDESTDITWNEHTRGEFGEIMDRYFQSIRRPFFHYALFAHSFEDDGSVKRNAGVSLGMPGSSFLVTVGRCDTVGGRFQDDCGTEERWIGNMFMHELGHNLGLDHGGAEAVNHKPNYLSVMNYYFSFEGVTHGPDYSWAAFPSLDERALNEDQPLMNPPGLWTRYTTVFTCPDGSPRAVDYGTRPDWNCDGRTSGVQQVDVNAAGGRTVLTGYDDWANLQFTGPSSEIGKLPGSGRRGPLSRARISPPIAIIREPGNRELRRFSPVLRADRVRPRLRFIRRRIRGRLRLVVRARDNKQLGRLVVYVDRHKPRVKEVDGRRARMRLTFRRGRHRIRAIVVDRAMNTRTGRVRVRGSRRSAP